MKFGLNFASPRRFEQVKRLHRDGKIAFIEILIDNFLHLDPDSVAADLDGMPVTFHIMFSRFLEEDRAFLSEYADRIRSFAAALRPLYLSDHQAIFSHHGRLLPRLVELDYHDGREDAFLKIEKWQEKLKSRLFLENFPSAGPEGDPQPEFFADMMKKTGAGVLFDLSNAVVAEMNGAAPVSRWLDVLDVVEHAHAAGYRRSGGESVIIDSHDGPLSAQTLDLLRRLGSRFSADATLVVERDAEFDFEAVIGDIVRSGEAVGATHGR